jgi:hypothetical protein
MATTSVVVPNYPTLLDVAKQNGSDGFVGLVDETIRVAPELQYGAARTIKGQNYKTLIRTALPSVGFRNANEGGTNGKSNYENRQVDTYILNPRIEVDQAVADKHEDGAEAFIATEGTGVMEASLQLLAKTFYYGRRVAYTGDGNPGTDGNAKGFPGLLDFVDAGLVLDRAGSAVGTSTFRTSVWGVKFGPQALQWVYGEKGQMGFKPTRIGDIYDAAGKRLTGYITEILAYPGLQMIHTYSVGRIKNITNEANKGLTDAAIGSWLAQFPAAFTPDLIFANRSAIESLRASRTATNATGAPAPTPTEYEGIPIVKTDMISNVEGADIA